MTALTLVRRIKARPSIVFDALTTAEGIASWWGPDGGPVLVAETDPQVGGRFRVRFRMLDGSEHESSGEYLEVVKPQRLAMSWRWTGRRKAPARSLQDLSSSWQTDRAKEIPRRNAGAFWDGWPSF